MVRRFAAVKAAVCAVALAGMVLLTGCGGGGGDSGGGKDAKAETKQSSGGKDSLSGTTWKYDDLILTFKSPNWTIKQNGKEIIKGTYTISDGQVTISFPDKGTTETRSIAGETLNISGFTFKKQ